MKYENSIDDVANDAGQAGVEINLTDGTTDTYDPVIDGEVHEKDGELHIGSFDVSWPVSSVVSVKFLPLTK